MIWLVIINLKDKIDLAQCFDYETDEYNFFPDKDGEPITFVNRDHAVEWIKDNINPDLICENSKEVRHLSLRKKYLK